MLPQIEYILDQEIKLDFYCEDGSPGLKEIKILCNEIIKRQAKRIFEFGTFKVQTSYNLYLNAPNATIYTLDLPFNQAPNLYCDKYNEVYIAKRLSVDVKFNTLLYDSAIFDIKSYLHSFDFIFIDACHNYEYVLNDSIKAIQMLSQKGVIFWHDYNGKVWPGVFNALNDLYQHSSMFVNLKHIKDTSLAMLEA